ncbi:hypothetical protein ASG93_20425 [Paenibacillus sp. Soil787]|nr:hypothetical protein ASG93_20425 [Paenibacillus sp. Soil787]
MVLAIWSVFLKVSIIKELNMYLFVKLQFFSFNNTFIIKMIQTRWLYPRNLSHKSSNERGLFNAVEIQII